MASVVEAACKEVFGRTGGAGFPLIFNGWTDSRISDVKRGLKRAGATVLVYHCDSKECCIEANVEDWMRRKRSGKEERVLILDNKFSSLITRSAGAGKPAISWLFICVGLALKTLS